MNSLDRLVNVYGIRLDQLEKLNEIIKGSTFNDSYCYCTVLGQLDESKSFSYALRYLRIMVIIGDTVGSETRRIINFLYEECNVTMDEIDKVVDYCATVLLLPGIVVFEDLERQYNTYNISSFDEAFNQLKVNVDLMENEGQ